MPPQTQSKKASMAGGGGGEDRISTLPDEVLHYVLSFLPAQVAVRTCVLAPRWRHLWKSIPVLHVAYSDVRASHKFLDHFLLLRDRSPLYSCLFAFSGFSADDVPYVNLWIRHVLTCHVRVLTVAIRSQFPMDDLPLVSANLTKLHLCLVHLSGKFLDFSSCPALEELDMTGCSIRALRISSRSVKRLKIGKCRFELVARTRISVPCLVSLQLTGIRGRAPLLEDMPELVTADVRFDRGCKDSCVSSDPGYCSDGSCPNCYGVDDGSAGCVLLKGLADATYLNLTATPKVFILRRDLRWCPTFTKLKTLLLNEWFVSADHLALICVLQHSPFLERLTLQISELPKHMVQSKAIYSSMDLPFASGKLKLVEITCQVIDLRIHNIMKSLITYGIPLEKINIQQTNELSECFSFVWTGFRLKQR